MCGPEPRGSVPVQVMCTYGTKIAQPWQWACSGLSLHHATRNELRIQLIPVLRIVRGMQWESSLLDPPPLSPASPLWTIHRFAEGAL